MILLLLLLQAKTIPGPGVAIPEADRAELERGIAAIAGSKDPDVAIVHKAIDWALRYNEFLDLKDVAAAKRLLKEPPKAGLATHAYRSKIDGSLQPYGMVVPTGYDAKKKHRLDFWLHGRDEKLTELRFLDQRRRSTGEFTPPDTLVLHLYGRFCNASKFAGEVDLFEALEDAKKRYSVDEDRLLVRGFSMGGASVWHLGAHHAGLWAAVAPGAGFAETPVYARMFDDPVKPTEWEQKLWHWYNATDYALNLANTTTIAYSGELDKQKQAADMMIAAAKAEGFDIPHLIGPKTEHKYEPETKKELSRRIDEIAAKGRSTPDRVRFTTWMLRYHRMHWVFVEGLEKHWERARVDAEIKDGVLTASTSNVAQIRFERNASKVVLDGQPLSGNRFRKVSGKWEAGELPGLRKRPGLQGPIDDAFLDAFVVAQEGRGFKEAAEAWRRTMRGDFPVGADDGRKNALYFGDYTNPKIAAIAKAAGFGWDAAGIAVQGKIYPGDRYTLALIYPDGSRYVVLNSGFTWAENAAQSNSRHVPLLPDWAVIDLQATGRMSQRVAAAGFFDEEWKLAKP